MAYRRKAILELTFQPGGEIGRYKNGASPWLGIEFEPQYREPT
jgi:hypothetical protein